MDFSRPCPLCVDGLHDQCSEFTCGCIADHPNDDHTIQGFKILKRALHPEREAWTKGGWKHSWPNR